MISDHTSQRLNARQVTNRLSTCKCMRAENISALPASSPFAWASCGPCGPCARQHGAPIVPATRQEPNKSSLKHLLSVSNANVKRCSFGGVSEATRVPVLALDPNTAPRAGPGVSAPAQPQLRRLGSRELCAETQARVLASPNPCTSSCSEPCISLCLVWVSMVSDC